MLRLLGNQKRLCNGLTRRDLLHIGGLGAFGVALHKRYDPVYTDFTAEGTTLAPEIRPGKAYMDPLLGIRPADKLELSGTRSPNIRSAH